MSKSSKRRAFHISTNLLTAGVLVGGVTLGAGCKPDHEVTSNPAPITPPQAASADMGVPKAAPEPKMVNPGPVPADMGVPKPAPDRAKAPAADASADEAVLELPKPSTLELKAPIYRPNVNTQHIRHRPPAIDSAPIKKP